MDVLFFSTYICFFLFGILIGAFLYAFILRRRTVCGIMRIDLSDSRKDLVRFVLTKDLDEIITHKYVMFEVDEKHEPDFFGGKDHER